MNNEEKILSMLETLTTTRTQMQVETNKRFDEICVHLDKVDAHLGKIETRIDKVDARLDKIEACLDKVEVRLSKVEMCLDKVEARLDSVEADIRIVFQQQNHDSKFIKVIYNQTVKLTENQTKTDSELAIIKAVL